MDNSHLLGSIEVFISVVDSGSFSGAARRLGLSQPSISRQVSRLEEHLGIRLLQRSTRRLSLTEAGQVYYEKARKIQREVIEAHQSISGFKETPSGLLKIATPYTWAETKITPHLSEFLQKYPKIKIDFECNDDDQDIIEDQLDLVIRVGKLKDSSFIAVPFGKIRLVLCATPQYIENYGKPETTTDLQNHNFITYQNYKQLTVSNNSSTQEIQVSGSVNTNLVSVMISTIQQHIGLSVLPDLLINQYIESGEMIDIMPQAEIHIKDLPIHQIFALYSNRKHQPAKVRAFLDFYRPLFT